MVVSERADYFLLVGKISNTRPKMGDLVVCITEIISCRQERIFGFGSTKYQLQGMD